jgi:type I restriction enzyme S subunit
MTWHEVSLKQICDVDWGNTKLTKSSFVENGKFLAVSAAGADGLIDHYEHEANVPVMSAIGAQCGRMFFPDAKFTAIKNTITLTPKENMADGKCLYYLLTHIQLPQRGAGQPFISKGDIEAFKVLIPQTLDEQRVIVKKLDNLFGETKLFEGKIQLQENLCDELLLSIQKKEYGKNIETVKIGDICKLMTGGTPTRTRKDFFLNGTVRWLVSGDIHKVEIFDCEGRITKEAMKTANTKILPLNSVMIALNGQGKTRGTVALLRAEATCNQSLVSISPINAKELIPEFLFYNLRMRYQEIRRMTGDDGNDRRGLNMNLIREIRIPLPSISTQVEVVEKLKLADQSIQDLKSKIASKREYARNLCESLLGSAFTEVEEVA